MMNVFPKVFTDIATPLRTTYSDIYITGERINQPPKFPCVMVVEADNYEDARFSDNSLTEKVAALLYEITVFSNKAQGKRSQCVEILSDIDDIMKRKNATRFSRIEGYFDSESTIYFTTARYRLKTDGTYWYTF